MDPITHTFAGAAMAGSGLRRKTALATPTLLVAANAPDIDILTMLGGPYVSLMSRRGLTHGLPAVLVLPPIVVAVVLLWARLRHRWPGERPVPVRPGWLLALATLGVASHPMLDWLNTYGMRWLVPFRGGWTYGDALFIVDPWMWLLLGGATFVAHSEDIRSVAAWAGLALLLTLPVFLADSIPPWARVAWLLGLAAWAVGRWRLRRGEAAVGNERWARTALGVAGVYIAAMVGSSYAAERSIAAEARATGVAEEIVEVMAGPAPADPLRREVVLQTPDEYVTGTFHWMRRPRVTWADARLLRTPDSEAVAAARSHPDVAAFLVWSRFPHFRVSQTEDGWTVEVRDARYAARDGGGLTGLDVRVDRAGRVERLDGGAR